MLRLETPENLVQFMKERNIKFEKITEQDAIKFLNHNTYYKKVSSYKNNFDTYIKNGKKMYRELDFGYLVELSTLDMEFRFLVLEMCLNVEHALKVRIMNKCLQEGENGIDIVSSFLNQNAFVRDNIMRNCYNSYCTDLIMTHQNKFPIWVILEVISFGDLCRFHKFLVASKFFPKKEVPVLSTVRDLRNAAAHNHCLFSKLIQEKGVETPGSVLQFVAKIEDITPTRRKNRLSSRCISDFVTLLYAFDYFVDSEGIRKHTKDELKRLFYERMIKNKQYFSTCITVKNAYNFVKKILDKFLESE